MTYGYFTADISTDAAYARPTDLRKSALRAFTGENFPSAPADAFVVSAQHNAPPPNRRVPIQPAYSAEHGKQNSTNKSNS